MTSSPDNSQNDTQELREQIDQWAKDNKVFLFTEPVLESLETLIHEREREAFLRGARSLTQGLAKGGMTELAEDLEAGLATLEANKAEKEVL